MITIICFISLWLICAAFSVSILLAFFQKKWSSFARENYREDFSQCWFWSLLLGPLSLLIALFFSGFCQYGLMNPFVLNKYKD